jgi:fused signal recognition particle receptor
MIFFKRKDKTAQGRRDHGLASQSPVPEAVESDKGVFQRLRDSLSKTRSHLTGRLDRVLLGRKEITGDLLEELEEILFTSDMGAQTTRALIEAIQQKVARKELADAEALKRELREEIRSYLALPEVRHVQPGPGEPCVIMVAGVNGVGKTTSIAKAAHMMKKQGKQVMLVAADTFRAAATEQLAIWGERLGVEVIKQHTGSDPSAVVFDGLSAGLARKADVILIDTAGRLHTKKNLMDELKKIQRVAGGKIAGAPHEVWLVLDATTGQNAISQAQMFNEALGVTSIVLTKLDGTAKGGIVVGISHQLGLPIKLIGIGEKMDDLRPFDAAEFARAIFDLS